MGGNFSENSRSLENFTKDLFPLGLIIIEERRERK
jgi:hypothetical protein